MPLRRQMPLAQSAGLEQSSTSARGQLAAQEVFRPPPIWICPQQTSPPAQLSGPEHVSAWPVHAAAIVQEVAPRAAIQQISLAGSHGLRPHAICGAPASGARLPSIELSLAALSLAALSLAALSLAALSLAASLSPEEAEPEDAPLPEAPWEPDVLVSPDEAVPLTELPVLEEPETAEESEPSAPELAVPEEPVAASSEPL